MRYVVTKSYVNVIGKIWWPYGATAAYSYNLDSYQVENAKDEEGNITRDSVEDWLSTNSGDFSEVIDFEANITIDDKDIEIPWGTEESEMTYCDCVAANEEF